MTQPVSPVAPTSDAVNKFHTNADVDVSKTSMHHTLGVGANQSSPGDHTHNGKNSKALGKGKDLTFPTTANAAYVQADFQKVINALRALGWGI